jgi:hypothetical protein
MGVIRKKRLKGLVQIYIISINSSYTKDSMVMGYALCRFIKWETFVMMVVGLLIRKSVAIFLCVSTLMRIFCGSMIRKWSGSRVRYGGSLVRCIYSGSQARYGGSLVR